MTSDKKEIILAVSRTVSPCAICDFPSSRSWTLKPSRFDAEAKENAKRIVDVADLKVLKESILKSNADASEKAKTLDELDDTMIDALSENIEDVLVLLNDTRSTVKVAGEEVDDFANENLAQMRDGLDQMNSESNEKQDYIATAKAGIKELDSNIEEGKVVIDETKADKEEAVKKIVEVDANIVSHELDMKASKDKYELETRMALEEHESWMADKTTEIDELKAEVAKLESDVDTASDELDAAQLDRDSKLDAANTKEATLSEMEEGSERDAQRSSQHPRVQ